MSTPQTPRILKESPITPFFEGRSVRFEETAGWRTVASMGSLHDELQAHTSGIALTDLSHLSKIHVRGASPALAGDDEQRLPGHARTLAHPRIAHLQLTADEALLLSESGSQDEMLSGPDPSQGNGATDVSGARACFLLSGPRWKGIFERSCAAPLCPVDQCFQSSLHNVPAVMWHQSERLWILPPRDLALSLWEALVDAGSSLSPFTVCGLDSLPQRGEG